MTGPAEERRSWTRQIMGLPISIHRRGPGDDGFVERIFDDLHGVDAMFSTYRVDSALSRLNRGELLESEMPAAFAVVMRLAGEFRNLTDGAFDVRFSKELDPSGLVKGWATEAAARWLPSDAYLNAGGDMVIKSPRSPWRVGIEHPADPAGLVAVLSVRNLAVATSGTTHRGNHIFDPRTGPALRWTPPGDRRRSDTHRGRRLGYRSDRPGAPHLRPHRSTARTIDATRIRRPDDDG